MIRTQKLEKINRLVGKYYIQKLQQNRRAMEYIHRRLPLRIIREHYIGYAPPDGFIEFLNKHDVSAKDAADLGLVYFDVDDNAFPMFSNRIMFPIIHAQRVVGFAGRIILNGNPKYLNTKSTILYDKKSVLYGLWHTRKGIFAENAAYLVEGYLDVLSLCAFGVPNSAALCGTALTIHQATLLKRYTNKVYTMLDADKAGNIAADRAKTILKKVGIYGGNITLPNGMDPDEYIRQYGKKRLRNVKIEK